MKSTDLRLLRQLAQLHGIQLSYLDMANERQEAAPETLLGLLNALGTPIQSSSSLREVVEQTRQALGRRCLEPVLVAWDEKPIKATVRLPRETDGRKVGFRLTLESHPPTKWSRCLDARPVRKSRQVDAASYVAWHVPLPALPLGYHQFEVETSVGLARSLVVSAPSQSYSDPEGCKRWGLFLPLYAARSERSWGAGSYEDWRSLTEWAALQGGTVVATLPLLAAFLDDPFCEPGPYSPASRLFWNEFFLDVEQVPEFAVCQEAQRRVRSSAFQAELGRLQSSREVKYCEEMALKRQVLALLSRYFHTRPSRRRDEYQRFLEQRPRVEDYARFRAACEQAGKPWSAWSERPRGGELRAGDYQEETKQYYAYIQWQAQQQVELLLQECRAHGTKLYLDLPLGVNPDSYDTWREQGVFASSARVGAPPDCFFTQGQDWGFAPLHPERIREQGYRYLLAYLRFQMQHAQILRIDHVMGLHRLYWMPQGLRAGQGAYVSYPADELYALLCLESHRCKTLLVGENLGTVPPEVNASMDRHQVRPMYVVQYETRPRARQALRPVPAHCVASVNTHDMPTFAAHWKSRDIADRAELGLIPKGDIPKHQQARRKLKTALAQFLQREGYLTGRTKRRAGRSSGVPGAAAVLRACLNWLSGSAAEVVLINLEDLWLEELPQNVPGTSQERPNWCRKARWTLEQIKRDPGVRRILKEIDRHRLRPRR